MSISFGLRPNLAVNPSSRKAEGESIAVRVAFHTSEKGASFAYVHTDRPRHDAATGLPYAVCALDDGGRKPIAVPTHAGAWSMTVFCAAPIVTDEGFRRLNYDGRATFYAEDFKNGVASKPLISPEAYAKTGGYEHGAATVTLVDGKSLSPRPASPEADKAAAKAYIEAAKWWYHPKETAPFFETIHEDLQKLHIEELDFKGSSIPYQFFMYREPLTADPEAFVENALIVAGLRFGLSASEVYRLACSALEDIENPKDKERPSDETVRFAILVASALQDISVSSPYLTDTDLETKDLADTGPNNPFKTRRNCVERFSTESPRVFDCGDCEDLAANILTVARSIVLIETYKRKMAKGFRGTLRCYLILQQLGCISKDNVDPQSALQDSDDAPGKKSVYNCGSTLAHSWIMMLSTLNAKTLFASSHEISREKAQLRDGLLCPWTKYGLPVMTVDGTTVKEVYPRWMAHLDNRVSEGTNFQANMNLAPASASSPSLIQTIKQSAKLGCVQCRSIEPRGSYCFMLISMAMHGVSGPDDGTTVKEMFWSTGKKAGILHENVYRRLSHMTYDYVTGAVRAHDAEVVRGEACGLTPTCVDGASERELAKRLDSSFLPVPAYSIPEPWLSEEEARDAELDFSVTDSTERREINEILQKFKKDLTGAGIDVVPWAKVCGAGTCCFSFPREVLVPGRMGEVENRFVPPTPEEFKSALFAVLKKEKKKIGVRLASTKQGQLSFYVRFTCA